MKYADSVILVFSKAPVAGQVKTRLTPPMTAEQAAGLHEKLTRDRLQMCTAAGLCDVQLWCSPDAHHPFFVDCRDIYGIPLQVQRGRDLGERMSSAIEAMLSHYNKVIIIGTDAPALDKHAIASAIERLDSADIVLGPAEDGGYVLIGASSHHDDLFKDVPWGTRQALSSTVRNIEVLGLDYGLLAECWDIDRPEDLQRYLAMQSNRAPG